MRKGSKASKLFISHSSKDKLFAVWLYEKLKRAGYDDVFLDVESLSGGDDWEEEIKKNVKSCDGLILVMSENIIGSRYIILEYNIAYGDNKPIIPIILPDVPLNEKRLKDDNMFQGVFGRRQVIRLYAFGVDQQNRLFLSIEKALQKASLYPRVSSPLRGIDRISVSNSDFQGTPEHYAGFVVSDQTHLVIHGIRGLTATGRARVNKWIKDKAEAEEPNRKPPIPIPAFVTVLAGKLFEDDNQVVSEAIQALGSLNIFSQDDHLFDLILRALVWHESVTSNEDDQITDLEIQLETLILNSFRYDLSKAIEKLQLYRFNALVKRLEEVDEPEDQTEDESAI